jgi:rubrerythrin
MRKHAGRSDARSNERGQASSKAANSRNGQSHSMSSRSNGKAKLSRNPISQLWLNDFLSEMLAVEEGGEKLYAKALQELQHDELRDKLEEFHEETQRHIELVREMMQTAGIDENHKSPTAAAAEQKAEGLLSVEVEDHLKDLNNIENLVLAETKDHWDWELLNAILSRIADSDLKDIARDAVREVFKQEREHLQWNQDVLTKLAMEAAEQQAAGDEEREEAAENSD